ncbi:MAG: CBS domain-containing protein [Vicinamibacterales bacterium]
MTPNPRCCRGDDTVDKAAHLMMVADVGLLPVVTDRSHKLIGVLTDRDIVVKVVAKGRDARSTAVSEVMTGDPVFCGPEAPVDAALERMATNQVRRMPIVDARGVIVGIISQADVATRLGKPAQTGQVVEAISESDQTTIFIPSIPEGV